MVIVYIVTPRANTLKTCIKRSVTLKKEREITYNGIQANIRIIQKEREKWKKKKRENEQKINNKIAGLNPNILITLNVNGLNIH